MPSASRNERKKRRTKRNLTIMKRAYFAETVARARMAAIFYAVLAKLDGEVEISSAAISSAVDNLTKLTFVVEPSAAEGFFMVKLVANESIPIAPVEQAHPEDVTVITPDQVRDDLAIELPVGE